jgi:hypothetical protein
VTRCSLDAMTSMTLSDQFFHLSFGDSNAPRDQITDTLLRRISIDRDTITRSSMKAFNLQRELNKEPDWPALLLNITAEDKRLVNLTSKEAAACLDRNHGVLEILRKAWDVGTFKEVRKLSTFPYLAHVFLLTYGYPDVLWPPWPKLTHRRLSLSSN